MKYDKMFDLGSKVAVVTGGAGLIGKELSMALSEYGATVVIAEADRDKGSDAAAELGRLRLKAEFRYLDITKEGSVLSLINSLDKKYGRIDIWINSAYPRTSDWGARFEDIKFDSWKKNVSMHMNGYFICCQKIAEYMKRQNFGSIINFGSTYGIVGPDFSIYKKTAMTMPAAYSAIKGGIINFTRYLASYYGKFNVRVNCVSPGGVYNKQPARFIKQYSQKTPLGRMADKEDIVGGVIFLASDASKYVTGHNLTIDGGWTAL